MKNGNEAELKLWDKGLQENITEDFVTKFNSRPKDFFLYLHPSLQINVSCKQPSLCLLLHVTLLILMCTD